jgi:monovalent cation/hydrogen antiporter
MVTFEWIIVLLFGAALLAALARKVGAPYPTFLALGGTLLAFVPASPN